ncbi:transcriptional regulator [Sphaerisporangium siamense]|uniref:AcrR family transcriptional regulator n=1 Tax=Sphaerisporangium siamense TaxID=795645 RepID=A0A7W7D6S9_9ACTN|nr:TetR/AcrR family transcriptional regulator [Sphaerisporangium siamense]MBB4701310.1 AcrR family transcriptional regulator [Sphaerisporangium siamense]GII87322.1 transcriptional regulator [Sphaerisporangium siamense]
MVESERDDEAMPAFPWDRAPRKRAAPPRVPLTRQRIIDAAFVVLDREGYDRLSMRQVAGELGVAVSALYAHVKGKEDLLQQMYLRLFEGLHLPEPDPERWQEQVKEYAREARTRLLAHRDMAKISMSSLPFGPEMLPAVEALVALFRTAGLPVQVAAAAGDMLSTFIDGFAYSETMWEERRRGSEVRSWEELRETLTAYFDALPPDRFPHLSAIGNQMFTEDNDTRFDLGLDIILRGLASYAERDAS